MFNELNQQIEERKARIEKVKELIDSLPVELAEIEGVTVGVDMFGDLDLKLPLNDKIFKQVAKLIAANFRLQRKSILSNGKPIFVYRLRNDESSADLNVILDSISKYSTCKVVQVGTREKLAPLPIFEVICEDGQSRNLEDLL